MPVNDENSSLACAVATVGKANIVFFLEHLISNINLKNKPGDRVLDVHKTKLVHNQSSVYNNR
jgi:hypothetical protein